MGRTRTPRSDPAANGSRSGDRVAVHRPPPQDRSHRVFGAGSRGSDSGHYARWLWAASVARVLLVSERRIIGAVDAVDGGGGPHARVRVSGRRETEPRA